MPELPTSTDEGAEPAGPRLPGRMRAAVQAEYGPPQSIASGTAPLPELRSGDVLVAVHVAGAETATLHLTSGSPALVRLATGLRRPRTRIPGLALSGTVVSHDGDVAASAWPAGTRVVGFGSGAYAEFARVKASALAVVPQAVTCEQAATLPISAITALQALRAAGLLIPDAATESPGESGSPRGSDGRRAALPRSGAQDAARPRVLVTGASGAVGAFVVQLARLAGAEVTAVCSGAKAAFVSELGAERVIDRRRQEVTELGERWDVVIDTAGNRPLRLLRRILTPAGSLVLVGGDAGGALLGGLERTLAAALLNPFTSQRLIGFVARENPVDLTSLLALVESGRLSPAIDSVHPLAETAVALRRVLDGVARGKVLVTPRAR